MSPAEQRSVPWLPEFPVGAMVSGHYILKASLFHITDRKEYLDVVKLKCCFFHPLKGSQCLKFSMLFPNVSSFLLKFTVSPSIFFYPLTPLIVSQKKHKKTPQKPPPRKKSLFQQAQSNGTNVGFMSQQLGHITNESICKIPADLHREVVPDPDFIWLFLCIIPPQTLKLMINLLWISVCAG